MVELQWSFSLLILILSFVDLSQSTRFHSRSKIHSNFIRLRHKSPRRHSILNTEPLLFGISCRGGAIIDAPSVSDVTVSEKEDEVDSLSERVNAAMKKLGIVPPSSTEEEEGEGEKVSFLIEKDSRPITSNDSKSFDGEQNGADSGCIEGVCPLPSTTETETQTAQDLYKDKSMEEIIHSISQELQVDTSIVMAAIGATMKMNGDNDDFNEMDLDAAKQMILIEKSAIASVREDSTQVKTLVSEGFDLTLSRRALAFTDMNVDNARAILIADEEDAKAEAEEAKRKAQDEEKKAIQQHEASMKTIRVDSSFDPTQLSSVPSKTQHVPTKTVTRDDVIFYATAATLESLILQSPVPVLLDVYADWCGPCKALTPILEDITLKAGGLFRLVKLNTDEERTCSQTLEVSALPTLFAIREGQILTSFQGAPPNEDFMKQFLMGLLGAGPIFPSSSSDEKKKLEALTTKLMKLAGASSFSFSQRETLQRKIEEKLDHIAKQGDLVDAEESIRTLRSLLSNVIRQPYDSKYRKINLGNKIIASKISSHPSAVTILKSVGFMKDSSNSQLLSLGDGKRYINLTALIIARDSIDKWIDRNRRNIAAAERKRVDDEMRSNLIQSEESRHIDDEVVEDVESTKRATSDVGFTNIQLRIEGKKKTHNIQLPANAALKSILNVSPLADIDHTNVTLTCSSKKLIVKANDSSLMERSFLDLKLYPTVAIVAKVGIMENKNKISPKLKDRAEIRKNLKKGEHTMQSVGIYAKDDKAKGELIDGGGGVWYEHDVSDEEEDTEEENNK